MTMAEICKGVRVTEAEKRDMTSNFWFGKIPREASARKTVYVEKIIPTNLKKKSKRGRRTVIQNFVKGRIPIHDRGSTARGTYQSPTNRSTRKKKSHKRK